MAQLIVRNIDDTLKMKLQIQAQQKGRSMEEEVRQIIRKALEKTEGGLGTKIAKYFSDLDMDFEIPEIKGQPLNNPFDTK